MLDASYGPNLNIASNGSWNLHLIVDVGGEIRQYTPRSEISLSFNDFPHLLLEVVSDEARGWDRYRMLLQAGCLARLGYSLRGGSKDPFIVSAIYIDQNLRAEWYLVYQPDTDRVAVKLILQEVVQYLHLWQVKYVMDQFDLKDPEATFKFVFRLYNLVLLAGEDNKTLGEVKRSVDELCLDVKRMGLPTLTIRKRKTEKANDSTKKSKNADGSIESDLLSDVAILEALEGAGYTIPPEVEGFVSLLPVRASLP